MAEIVRKDPNDEGRGACFGGRKSITGYDLKKEIVLEGNVKLISSLEFPAETMCCRYDNSKKLIAIGLANGWIKVYSTESRCVVYNLAATGTDNHVPVTCLQWKPDSDGQQYGNLLLATYASGFVRLWHVTTGKCLIENRDDFQMMTCAYNKTGEKYVVGRSDGKIDLFDGETNKIINVLEPSPHTAVMDGHVMRIFTVVYHPTEDVFVSGGWDDTLQWWDPRVSDTHSIKKIVGPHVCGEGIDIHPQTSNMLVSSWRKDNSLQVFDFGSGKLLAGFNADYDNKSMLYCCQWLNRDTVICGGSHVNSLTYYDVLSRQPVGRVSGLSGAVYSIDNNRLNSSHRHPVVAMCSGRSLVLVEDTI